MHLAGTNTLFHDPDIFNGRIIEIFHKLNEI
ncbi:hypothetical protein RSAG8_13868, partial [Rhizoctonia solani AG-8 WAC10335]